MAKQSQLDKAIENLEAEKQVLEAAIGKLKEQRKAKASKPTRPVAVEPKGA